MVSNFKELIDEPELKQSSDSEVIFVTNDVSWDNYETLGIKLEENSHYRLTYLDGVLEIVSPSKRHESAKTRISFLVSLFLWKKQITYFSWGSATLKNEAKKAGAEPDECFCIGEEKDIPDLVIEVVITSGSISKLETYRRLEVAEIWFWQSNQFKLYHLRDISQSEQASIFPETYGYEEITTSELLPELDIALLTRCLLIADLIQSNNEFDRSI
ncbi:Uma2 family endonuclease [Calothrix sp. UHCC 0171]|uniref:Uma2 family endonuclease n=1 Tax=Calothrix sp. UHCC 0171 TaxID=3110245 RepID=UPI002B210E99|nr:Uma2 family endonuclease [Calothrix sp. UHCC 0171]MEA5573552.1 Uma2 family endonuclease [Calothrix sp. UHCC 0171]